jgi:hypothetical protein
MPPDSGAARGRPLDEAPVFDHGSQYPISLLRQRNRRRELRAADAARMWLRLTTTVRVVMLASVAEAFLNSPAGGIVVSCWSLGSATIVWRG